MTDDSEVFKLSPWNKNNKQLTLDDVYTIYEKCGFQNVRNTIIINDLSLYQTAFVHSSYARKKELDGSGKLSDKKMTIIDKPPNVLDLFPDD